MGQQFHVVTLEDMVGNIRRIKPTCDYTLARDFLNQAVRTVLDRKVVWAGTVRRGVIAIPAAVSAGTVSLVSGSPNVTGGGTNWPTNDLVNTTVAIAVTDPGLKWITPLSMTGITVDSVLYADRAGIPEMVRVIETRPTSFRAEFTKPHVAAFTLEASSLAGRQLRLSSGVPPYTILAVPTSTSLILDTPWAGANLSGSGHQIVKMYYSLEPDLKHLMAVVDPAQGRSLQINYAQSWLDAEDPNRTRSGPPQLFANMVPSAAGNMQYELYPIPTEARQLNMVYSVEWPEMRAAGDRPPHFINPNIFIWDALSRALRQRLDRDDPYYNEVTANWYGAQAERELISAMNADESKLQTQLDYIYRGAPALAGLDTADMSDGCRWW